MEKRGLRQAALAALLFALAGTAATIVVAASALAGLELSGRPDLSTLPLGLGMLGGLAATLPASHLMARRGRRLGFQAFTAMGLAGAALCALALERASFALFCLGSPLVGAMTGAAQFYRYAAAEAAPAGLQERAIGTVLAGGVVAGLAGPPAAAWTAHATDAPFSGSYLLIAALAAAVLALLPLLDVPRPAAPQGPRRPVRELLADRVPLAAAVAGATAFGAMVLTMVAAPLSLRHGGHGLASSGRVLQAHVVAMYLPSFATGRLVARWGPAAGTALGLAFLGGCVAVNLGGGSVAHHGVALVLLGVGWNLLFVASTALLARRLAPADRAAVQGTTELVSGTAAVAAAFLAGPVHGRLGWDGLNLAVAVLLAVASLFLLALLRRPRAAAAPEPASA